MFEIKTLTEATLATVTPRPPTIRSRKLPYGLLQTANDGKRQHEHVIVAERAIGHRLPPGAEVHHLDENPTNNAPTNLVICPEAAYHKLLHQRQRAFDACGHYDWRRCQFCKAYDDPVNLWTDRKKAYHRSCAASARRAYNHPRKEL